MQKDNIEQLFESLKGSFDTEEPVNDHQERFLEKLKRDAQGTPVPPNRVAWWKPMSIAAAVAVLFALGIRVLEQTTDTQDEMANMSPEISNTQFYFTHLIQEQVRELQLESSPETQKIISDTMRQLSNLEADYGKLEQEMISGGNNNMLLKAMITNFQTRIDLLEDVLLHIETIKNLKNYDDANHTL